MGPMSAMIQIADRNYLERRTIEFINEAEIDRISSEEESYQKNLRMAIRCLILAMCKE
jgi:hypothetical protein